MTLKEKIAALPTNPGVYIMKDSSGKVIYVGKAIVLKNRVKQYFSNSVKPIKVQAMVDNIADFEYIITLSEKDALTLEANLVKKYNPHYNILLKDDKASPYIKIDLRDDFPTVEVTRKLMRDGAKYFGPYLNGVRVWELVNIIKSAYGMRTCSKKYSVKRECLDYHIGLCKAPCTGKITKEAYSVIVDKVFDFLSGKDGEAVNTLTQKMNGAVEREDFERAIEYREQLAMLKRLKDRNIADIDKITDVDAFSIAVGGNTVVSVNVVRAGKMMGLTNYFVDCASWSAGETLAAFALQYYEKNLIPDEVCFAEEFESDGLAEYLKTLKGGKVDISFPKKGSKKKLIDMARQNAEDYLLKNGEKDRKKREMTVGACERLGKLLGLPALRRIECYDISHISGVDKVASGVCFIDGEPSKKNYRRYRIKTVEGNDDFACMKEVLLRRAAKIDEDNRPDLVVIDGGKGQLSAAVEAVKNAGGDLTLISLAKREEEIFRVGSSEPIVLTKNDNALKLLQRIRDEAHRFAITYHRNLHAKTISSELEKIKGVGPKKRKILLAAYPDPKSIRTATFSELSAINGIDEKTAQSIIDYFNK